MFFCPAHDLWSWQSHECLHFDSRKCNGSAVVAHMSTTTFRLFVFTGCYFLPFLELTSGSPGLSLFQCYSTGTHQSDLVRSADSGITFLPKSEAKLLIRDNVRVLTLDVSKRRNTTLVRIQQEWHKFFIQIYTGAADSNF
jgi:hypothetical protein